MTAVLGGHAAPMPRGTAEAPRPTPSTSSNRPAGTPLISVVMPTYKRPDLLLRCLHALLVQTIDRDAFEIVVVDDAHEDGPRALVTALAADPAAPMLRYIRPARGRGPAVARNAGWRAAHGEIVAFTDDDTLPAPDWLERGEAAMRAGNWVALGGRVVVPLAGGGNTGGIGGPNDANDASGAGSRNGSDSAPTDHERMTQGLERTEFVTANAFVRRNALVQVQGFDERFTRAWREDSDLQFRLEQVGPVGRCEDAVVLHPVRPERWGVSLRQQKNAFFEALLYAKHPQRYVTRLGLPTPWEFYAITLLGVATPVLAAAGGRVRSWALISSGIALALVARFAARRLRQTSRAPSHVLEMIATSALIPFLSVYWRLRGALHFRVLFL